MNVITEGHDTVLDDDTQIIEHIYSILIRYIA